MSRRFWQSLRSDTDGATLVEFAMVAPILLALMMGTFDVGYNMYANTMLQGAIQEAARDSTIEGATPTQVDAAVSEAVRDVVPQANITFSRKAYSNFSDVARPEDYTDVNGDGSCNDGEPFEDANDNGYYDSDRGVIGNGGARDAVLYEVSVSYPRAFPVASFVGMSPDHATKATTVVRNQPFSLAQIRSKTANCT